MAAFSTSYRCRQPQLPAAGRMLCPASLIVDGLSRHSQVPAAADAARVSVGPTRPGGCRPAVDRRDHMAGVCDGDHPRESRLPTLSEMAAPLPGELSPCFATKSSSTPLSSEAAVR